MVKNKKLLGKKFIIIAALVVTVLAVGFYVGQDDFRKGSSASERDISSQVNKVDYGPPTEEEASAGDKQKRENIQRNQLEENTSKPNSAQVVLVDASQYGDTIEIRSYVANVFEDGGTCTAIVTKNGEPQITKSSTGFRDAKTTQCGTITIPRTALSSSGSWQVIVKYESSSASGQSSSSIIKLN